MLKASILWLLLMAPAIAQTVAVKVTVGDYTYEGRGVVVAPTLVATADHVIEVDEKYYIPEIWFGEKRVKATEIVKRWPDRDLAIVRVSVPDGTPVVPISDDEPDTAWSINFDGEKRTFRRCNIVYRNSFYFDYIPRNGESGGPVFTEDKKLIGVVSGGWFRLEDKPAFTWPLRVGRVDVLREYIDGSPR